MRAAFAWSGRYLAFVARLLVGCAATGLATGAVAVAGIAAWTHHPGGFVLALATAAACAAAVRASRPWMPPRRTRATGRG